MKDLEVNIFIGMHIDNVYLKGATVPWLFPS